MDETDELTEEVCVLPPGAKYDSRWLTPPGHVEPERVAEATRGSPSAFTRTFYADLREFRGFIVAKAAKLKGLGGSFFSST